MTGLDFSEYDLRELERRRDLPPDEPYAGDDEPEEEVDDESVT